MLKVAFAGAVVAALLAIGAGIAKVMAPESASAALRARRLPSHPILVRVGGLAECTIGVLALFVPSILPRVVLFAVYAVLTGFVLSSVRSTSGAPCGCFGASSTPATWRHVALDAVLSLALLGSFAATHDSVATAPGASMALRAAVLTVGAVCACLAASSLTPAGRSRRG
jgi:hypothetical protein